MPPAEESRLTGALRLEAGEADAGERLDAFLAARLAVGRRTALRLAERSRVNGRRARKGQRLAAGDRVDVEAAAEAAERPLEPAVVSSDDLLLVLDKPAGLPTTALRGRGGASVAEWLRQRHPECEGVGGSAECGVVHRLDTWTSGLLLVARTPPAHARLREQFRRHEVEKAYLAVVWGDVRRGLVVDAAIGQHRKSRTRVRALAGEPPPHYDVTPAKTAVAPLRRLGPCTLVEARTRTGARHQVRAHLAFAGHPLVADARYGGAPHERLPHHLLHAAEITWRDVASDETRTARLAAPAAWRRLLDAIGPDDAQRDG